MGLHDRHWQQTPIVRNEMTKKEFGPRQDEQTGDEPVLVFPTLELLPQEFVDTIINQSGEPEKKHAYTFLEKAVSEMKDRAIQRDNAGTGGSPGERSMASTVKAFNALTGHTLSESEGWEFMILLKLVRGRQGAFRADDYVDAAAYAGLLGECASVEQKK